MKELTIAYFLAKSKLDENTLFYNNPLVFSLDAEDKASAKKICFDNGIKTGLLKSEDFFEMFGAHDKHWMDVGNDFLSTCKEILGKEYDKEMCLYFYFRNENDFPVWEELLLAKVIDYHTKFSSIYYWLLKEKLIEPIKVQYENQSMDEIAQIEINERKKLVF